jgi:hypothetical protein
LCKIRSLHGSVNEGSRLLGYDCQTSIPQDLKDFFKVEQSNKNSCVGRRVHYTMYNNVIYSECDLCKILHLDMLDEI